MKWLLLSLTLAMVACKNAGTTKSQTDAGHQHQTNHPTASHTTIIPSDCTRKINALIKLHTEHSPEKKLSHFAFLSRMGIPFPSDAKVEATKEGTIKVTANPESIKAIHQYVELLHRSSLEQLIQKEKDFLKDADL